MQPKAKMSTDQLYLFELNANSGALYHLVDTYSVNGVDLSFILLAKPKSASFNYLPSSEIKKFSGFISLCMYPFLCTYATAYTA